MSRRILKNVAANLLATALIAGGISTASVTPTKALAAQPAPITVVADGAIVTFADKQPTIIDGHAVMPVKEVAEAMGWTITITADSSTVSFSLNKRSGKVGDKEAIMSASEIARRLSADASWDNDKRQVTFRSKYLAKQTKDACADIFTAAPEVGIVPAKILLPGKTDVKSADSFYKAYSTRLGEGCIWYAYGRFYETRGIPIPAGHINTRGQFKDFAPDADITFERDINKIISGCVAVFSGKTANDSGHVIFIEYVERSADGLPQTVYYTDANTTGTNYYDAANDGKIKKVDFASFAIMYENRSVGYRKVFEGYVIPKN